LVATVGDNHDNLGVDVAVTNGMVVAGTQGDDDQGNAAGAVYVFKKNSTGQYEQARKFVASDGTGGENFGIAVAATAYNVVVGANGDQDNGLLSGSAYVFGV
jgi:hypothetical protein